MIIYGNMKGTATLKVQGVPRRPSISFLTPRPIGIPKISIRVLLNFLSDKNMGIEVRLPFCSVLSEVDVSSLMSNGICHFLFYFWNLHQISSKVSLIRIPYLNSYRFLEVSSF